MPEQTIQLVQRARGFASRVAIVAPEGEFTYASLLEASERAAGVLLAGTSEPRFSPRTRSSDVAGTLSADLDEARVAFMAPGGWHYVVVKWAVWRAGGIAVPLKLTSPQQQLEYVIDDSQAAITVAHPQYEALLRPIAERRGLRFLLTTEVVEGAPGQRRSPSTGSGRADTRPEPVEGPHRQDHAPRLPRLDGTRPAMVLYTSGTTSLPKGVLITHGNIQAQAESLVQAWEWSQDDRTLLFLPLDHIHGIVNILTCALWSGAVCEMMPAFDAEKVWGRICQGGLTVFMAVPDVYSRLISAWEKASPERQRQMSEACRKMRLMVSGSSALPVPRLEAWRRITGHTLLERYGMTEIGMALSNPLRGERRPGYVGQPLPGVEVQLIDESGQPVEAGSPGEILVRGKTVFREYRGRPEATAAAFTRDGWFRTGDLAVIEDGAYRILGRLSADIIKSGGEKVSALEIEPVLMRHPSVADCAVVGVPDEKWGEAVTAAVVLKQGCRLTLPELREFVRAHLAPASVPTRLQILDSLPRNAMGKVVKPDLRRLIEERAIPSPSRRGQG
jgi:malonyl-CoA/methylmalonyl-CoA synthetase